jgi:hypothetical protein
MPRVGFEFTIPASRRARTFHALDHWATVTGEPYIYTCVLFREVHVISKIFQPNDVDFNWDFIL